MRLVKYWHVKLFQLSHISSLALSWGASRGGFPGGPLTKLLAEGYSLIEPQRLLRRNEFISLFTSPNSDDREFCQFRIDDIHSMLATPVYEEDEPAKNKGCHCLLTAGLDTQKDRVVGIVGGCQEGHEPVFQTALSGTLINPEWINTAQPSLKDLLYKSMSQGDISTGKGESLANFVFNSFTAMDNNLNNVADFINMANRLSEKSSDLKRRMKNLYEIIIADQSHHTCAHDGDIPRSPTAVALDRLSDVSDDLSSIDGMLSDIEAKVPTHMDWDEILGQRKREI
ncbi:hypothetical protein ACQFN5_15975 [Klebsiella sp. WOUb02]|uniref:hypothetical protein n=1 Tax=Klebsiella sp. WOUb02 TaxID=3161071 RepID=UPI003CF3DA78